MLRRVSAPLQSVEPAMARTWSLYSYPGVGPLLVMARELVSGPNGVLPGNVAGARGAGGMAGGVRNGAC